MTERVLRSEAQLKASVGVGKGLWEQQVMHTGVKVRAVKVNLDQSEDVDSYSQSDFVQLTYVKCLLLYIQCINISAAAFIYTQVKIHPQLLRPLVIWGPMAACLLLLC